MKCILINYVLGKKNMKPGSAINRDLDALSCLKNEKQAFIFDKGGKISYVFYTFYV